ncbi:MAG: T9SS type A sorting domain-containing protein [Bacteroidia bacterium]|nr:T9SS type A sorting domain-containing protein [Bacteroidia bacterium]
MKKYYLCLVFIEFFTFNIIANQSNPLNASLVSFTENKGQISDQNNKPRPDVLFSGTDGKMAFHIRNNGVSYQLYRVDSYKEEQNIKTGIRDKIIDKSTIYRIDSYWENCNSNLEQITDDILPGYFNYYREVCPNGITNVKSFSGVTLKNLYANIDVHYYDKNGVLKCDYLVNANANYKLIKIKIKGAKVSLLKDGSLQIKTDFGIINEEAPIVYQNGKILNSKWIINDNVLSFDIKNYNSSLPLVIDPATRVWSTYYGDNTITESYGSCTDASSNVYISGYTAASGTVIATSGSHQSTAMGANAFLAKFDQNGVRLWGTYYGAGSIARACVTDKLKNVYLVGSSSTSTSSLVSTPGSHQPNISGPGGSDGFLVKFDSAGVRLWGTFYGASGSADVIYSVATNKFGDVFIAGNVTGSPSAGTGIATVGSHQPSFGTNTDCFLAMFNSSGVRYWGTYYGGNLADVDAFCCADTLGNVYLSGSTASSTGTVIATPGSHKSTFGGSTWDAFLAKFNSSGVRQWGTYYGGNVNEYGFSCTTDVVGNVFLAGRVDGNSTGISTSGVGQNFFGGGADDAFLVKFNSSGIRQWGTFYGGSGSDKGYSCSTDKSGSVYLAGVTTSTNSNFIATSGNHQTTFGGGTTLGDAFLARFSSSGIRLWGTYYGGNREDEAESCSTDNFGNVYLTGRTTSTVGTTMATSGSHQPLHGSTTNYNGYLAKFNLCTNNTIAISVSTLQACAGKTIAMSVYFADTYTLNPGNIPITTSFVVLTPTVTTTYTVDGEIVGCGSVFSNTVTINITPYPAYSISSTASLICVGQSATLTASGTPTAYLWNPGGSGSTIVVSPSSTFNYTVTGTDASGCNKIDTITVFVSPCTKIDESESEISLSVYPNPGNDVINVVFETIPDDAHIELYNSLGQLILNEKIISMTSKLDIRKLSNGIYHLLVNADGKKIVNKKILKE